MSRIFLWDAGGGSGTAGSPEVAFEMAAPYVRAGHEGTVKEAEVSLMSVGHGGAVSEHVPTGKAWRGCLAGGAPSWSPAACQKAAPATGGPA